MDRSNKSKEDLIKEIEELEENLEKLDKIIDERDEEIIELEEDKQELYNADTNIDDIVHFIDENFRNNVDDVEPFKIGEYNFRDMYLSIKPH